MTKPTNPSAPHKAIECRFAVYSKAKDGQNDIHLIKEQVHNADGTITPNVKIVENYLRDFFITNKAAQNHTDRKEWEHKRNLTRFRATQTQLQGAIFAALGQPGYRGQLRTMPESRFVYGSDINSTAIIKQKYRSRWDIVTPYTYAPMDTETDMLHGHGQIMMASITFKHRVYTVVRNSFVQGYHDPVERILALCQKYLNGILDTRENPPKVIDVLTSRGIAPEIVMVDSEIEVVQLLLKKAHEWQPDFLSAWNLDFDMTKILEACARAGVQPEDIMCDPRVKPENRSFRYKRGEAKKVTSSGKVLSYALHQRWHTVFCPSSFYWIDAMCVYKQVRTGAPEESSYSLDNTLDRHLGIRKLKFKEADHLPSGSPDWHKFMQKNHPLEYVVYNIFDCISMELLDELTTDVALSLPMFLGCSDFQHTASQPRRAVNDLHYFVQEHDNIIGSTSSDMDDEFDEETLGIGDWIVMLDAHLVADNGLCLLREAPMLPTNVRVDVYDLDVAAAYPTNEDVFNVSKETTAKELICIQGIPEEIQRMQTINLSAGRTNATEFAVALYGLPTLDDMLSAFLETES